MFDGLGDHCRVFVSLCICPKFQKEEESGDQFQMEITVTEPKKMGDGMGSYMAYKVNTKVNLFGCFEKHSFKQKKRKKEKKFGKLNRKQF